jgi:hypothetical protein
MAQSAYDILGLLNQQGQRNVELVSGLIDSGFKNATVGVRQASDIMSQTVSAALDYKKTLIDTWYKGEVLKHQDKELNAITAYRDATLQQNERQMDITEQRYKDLDAREREQTEQAARNKNTYGFLSEKRRLYESSIRGIQNLLDSNRHTLQSLQKNIDEQGHRWPKSQYDAAQKKIEELQSRIIGGENQINNLVGDLGNLGNAITGLANGVIDSDAALRELDMLSPTIKNTSPDARPLGVLPAPPNIDRPLGSPPSSNDFGSSPRIVPNRTSYNDFNPTTAAVDDPINFQAVNEDDERYDLQQTLAITQRLFEKGGNNALPEINNFIQNRANNQAQRYFDYKKTELEKSYFQDLFSPIQMGDFSKDFRLNEESLRKQYLAYGGNQEKLDKLKQFVGSQINRVSKMSTPEEQNKEIQKLVSQVFTDEAKKNLDTTAEGYQLPPKILGSSGVLVKPNEKGGYEVSKIPDEINLQPATDVSRQVAEIGSKNREVLNKVIGGYNEKGEKVNGYALTKDNEGKTTLSKRALETLAGLKYNELIDIGILKPFAVNTSQSGTLLSNEVRHSVLNPEAQKRINREREAVIKELIKPENRPKALNVLVKLESM